MDAAIRAEALQQLQQAVDLVQRRLKEIDPSYAAIFQLRLDGTHTNKEIAKRVGCSESTVKRCWVFAVGLLKSLLDESLVDRLAK
jgi:DNA-directed RNA polymerase specialized sigma24 family protein